MTPADPTGATIELSGSGLVFNCAFDLVTDLSYQVTWYIDDVEVVVVNVNAHVSIVSWALEDITVDYYGKPVRMLSNSLSILNNEREKMN